LSDLTRSRVARFYTLLLGADRGIGWREHGYQHPLGDDWGYARCAAPGRATAAELAAAVDQVPPQAVGDLGFFVGTREEVAETLAAYADAGLTYASIVNYSGRIAPALRQEAADDVEFVISELQR
jgi:phthiodiolone/phenolphthiodiolone dimycocerosates ketoreductase